MLMDELLKVPDFSARLRKARLSGGYPEKADIIRKLGINRVHYYRIENGERANPSWETFYRFLVGADLPLECFFPPAMIVAASRRIAARKQRKARQ